MQRPAKPSTPVRFRPPPPNSSPKPAARGFFCCPRHSQVAVDHVRLRLADAIRSAWVHTLNVARLTSFAERVPDHSPSKLLRRTFAKHMIGAVATAESMTRKHTRPFAC